MKHVPEGVSVNPIGQLRIMFNDGDGELDFCGLGGRVEGLWLSGGCAGRGGLGDGVGG